MTLHPPHALHSVASALSSEPLLALAGTRERAGARRGYVHVRGGPAATIRHADRAWRDRVRARNDRKGDLPRILFVSSVVMPGRDKFCK